MRAALLPLAALLLTGCASRVDRFLVEGPIGAAMRVPDIDLACRGANGQYPTAASLFVEGNPPDRAMTILAVTAATCSEAAAMEAELAGERAAALMDGEAKVAAVKDSREQERRLRALTARRMWMSWQHLEHEYGPVGEGECPKLKRRMDELTWFMGLVAGANALLQDQASGGEVGVPVDVLGKVARGAECIDDAAFWHAPGALRAGAWAMVPGSGPDGVDPWVALEEAAARGDAVGMRVGRAMQVQLAANAGRDDEVRAGIRAAAAVTATPDPDHVLLDAYALSIIRHQADLLWTRERGYRARTLGELPGDTDAVEPGSDPFGGDPFAEDPFGGDPSDEAPSDEAGQANPDEETP